MGYDMSLENTAMDTEQVAAKENATAQFDLACKRRDAAAHGTPDFDKAQAQVKYWYDQMYDQDMDYFRLNIWGMGTMRNVMDHLGMLYTGPGEREWPKRPDVDENVLWKIEDALYEGKSTTEFGSADLEKVQAYHDATERARRYVVGDTPGIMLWKLCSNDDWLVTPAECKSALMKWTEIGVDERDAIIWGVCNGEGFDTKEQAVEWVVRWMSFLERGSRCGGFRVR